MNDEKSEASPAGARGVEDARKLSGTMRPGKSETRGGPVIFQEKAKPRRGRRCSSRRRAYGQQDALHLQSTRSMRTTRTSRVA